MNIATKWSSGLRELTPRILCLGAIFVFLLVGPTDKTIAQAPASFSFQGYLTDPSDNPIDGTQTVIVKFYSAPAGGTLLWSRDYGLVAIDDGVFRLSLDFGTPFIGEVSFEGLVYMELTIGGEVISPRILLQSVPTARGLSLPIKATRSVDGHAEATLKIKNTATSGENYAIFGESHAPGGNGIRGWATSTTGNAFGVYGESASTTGRGVFGRTTATSGVNYGVYGLSVSTSGRGLVGVATAASGSAYGVHGESASTTGRAVYGLATNATGVNYGVYGETVSPTAIGVYGVGGEFGVRGSTNQSFATAGVSGTTDALSGFGGHFTGGSGTYTEGVNNNFPDLVLGGNGGTDDDGRIYSDRSQPSSDIWLHSNDAVVVILDNDGDGEDSDFEIRDKDGLNIFNVDENGTVTADGVVVHVSDRNRKEDIVPVDAAAILKEIADLPIHSWRYKGQPETHIGPMAQDFYAAFGLGIDDRHLAGSDATGVAIAAIQALHEASLQLQAQVSLQRLEIDRLQKSLRVAGIIE